ncbi:Uncharacterised protein [uncultured Clostridium sp.]|uniref:hypothetical protein n=1 Tax=uncultured Clostridium sp. TaxID=59620 RepID=UPI0008218C3E|nr:hypothetical protein [uncultured Clostridium sp.]SCK03845.1 Uncharacterised protein [uncultured Clostridium sp.]
MKGKIIIGIILISTLIGCLSEYNSSSSCSFGNAIKIFKGIVKSCPLDIQSSYSETYMDAEEVIQRGWVPKDIPESATCIKEIHNIDTNLVNGKFLIPTSDINQFIARFSKVDKSEIKEEMFLNTDWMDKSSILKEIENNTFVIGGINEVIYAVNQSGYVYYWYSDLKK